MSDEVTYEWFYGKLIDGTTYEMYELVALRDGTNRFVPLEQGQLYTFGFTAVPFPGQTPDPNILKLSFDYEPDTWPSDDWTNFPRPSPFDPKYPRGSLSGEPYGDAATYRLVLDSLPESLALKEGFVLVQDLILTSLADIYASFSAAIDDGGDFEQLEELIPEIRDWVVANINSDAVQAIQNALPLGLSRAGGHNFDEARWYPLGWEVKTIYGYLAAHKFAPNGAA